MRSQLHAQGRGRPGTSSRLHASRCVKHVVGTFRRPNLRVAAFQTTEDAGKDQKKPLHTKLAIIGGGPAGHTAAIYAARAELEPIVFEGWMAAGIAPGGQLTTTTFVENFPGFVEPIMGYELTDKFRAQSVRYGTRVLTETITSVELRMHDTPPPGVYINAKKSMEDVSLASVAAGEDVPKPRGPFKLWTPERCITADAVIIATGASAKRLRFPGSGDETEGGFWNRGISACAICDGSSPIIRNKPVAVVGGGDSAMEEAMFLTRYASKVYVIHRFNYLEASKAMVRRALSNPKIEVLWCTEVLEAHGNDQGCLGSITVARSPIQAAVKAAPAGLAEVAPPGAAGGATAKPPVSLENVEVNGLFFAIGHRPATDFLKGQVDLDDYGYIITVPGRTTTSVPGVFAAGDVMDRNFRQAITAAGSGCMAALEAERYLQALESSSAPAMASGNWDRGAGAEAAAKPAATAAFDFGSTAAELDSENFVTSGGA